MGHLFEEYGHWTYGMECETNCMVIVNGSFDFLMIKNPKNKIALRVSGDMGNDKEGRTVEIVTEPICIADKKSHDNNMLCICLLYTSPSPRD